PLDTLTLSKTTKLLNTHLQTPHYKQFMAVYKQYTPITKTNYYLTLHNKLHITQKKLLILKNQTNTTITLQSVRDIDWQYIFHSTEITTSQHGIKTIPLHFILSTDKTAQTPLLMLPHTLTLHPQITGDYELSQNDVTLTFTIHEIPEEDRRHSPHYDEYR